MRSSSARLAKQVSERYLSAGHPTGLTGLLTHPAPRPALIKIYNRTLEALQSFPKDSAYRTSVEAITKHRLSIIEGTKPEGYEAWAQRREEQVKHAREQGNVQLVPQPGRQRYDDRDMEWDATGLTTDLFDGAEGPFLPGELARVAKRKPATAKWLAGAAAEGEAQAKKAVEEFVAFAKEKNGGVDGKEIPKEQLLKWAEEFDQQKRTELAKEPNVVQVEMENEPPLTAQQVIELEGKFGAGLLEEVIEVAKGELSLVSVMEKHKVWEELVEREPEGQWSYFERARHVKETQKP